MTILTSHCWFGHRGPEFTMDRECHPLFCTHLEALYACAHGLACTGESNILDPAEVICPDYPLEAFPVLEQKELCHHNEYRTYRLVLAAWDRMEASDEFTARGT